jgi:hypothetical protein
MLLAHWTSLRRAMVGVPEGGGVVVLPVAGAPPSVLAVIVPAPASVPELELEPLVEPALLEALPPADWPAPTVPVQACDKNAHVAQAHTTAAWLAALILIE